MNNRRKLALIKEVRRRKLLKDYEVNFEKFANDQIKIVTKDAKKGFVPFYFNDAQTKINNKLDEQLRKTKKLEL